MRVGFVAIIGRPNVGKSTLLNKIIDYKLSITTATPQTTRNQIRGIYNDDESQIILIDTPGIHKPKQKLGEILNETSYQTLKDADLVLFLQPADEELGPGDRFIIRTIKEIKQKLAIITKVDLIDESTAKLRMEQLSGFGFEVIGVSCKDDSSIKALVDTVKAKMPEQERFYPLEDITDISMRFFAKEVIRESVIENTREELPHSVGIVIDRFDEPDALNNRYYIEATIFVERESQKGIIIGAGGEKIKTIGTVARHKIIDAFGENTRLDLRVKVSKNWTSKIDEIKKMGY